MTRTVEKEMSITHAEFYRILPGALPPGTQNVDGDNIVVADGERRLEIAISEEGQRRIGFLTLPVTVVRLEFTGYDDDGAEAALLRFDRAFQRGGG